jgi:hypothetical protein
MASSVGTLERVLNSDGEVIRSESMSFQDPSIGEV